MVVGEGKMKPGGSVAVADNLLKSKYYHVARCDLILSSILMTPLARLSGVISLLLRISFLSFSASRSLRATTSFFCFSLGHTPHCLCGCIRFPPLRYLCAAL